MKIDKKTAFKAIVAKNLIECGLTKSDLALKLFMSKASIYNKLNDPDSFTFKELKLLFQVLKFTQDEILRVI